MSTLCDRTMIELQAWDYLHVYVMAQKSVTFRQNMFTAITMKGVAPYYFHSARYCRIPLEDPPGASITTHPLIRTTDTLFRTSYGVAKPFKRTFVWFFVSKNSPERIRNVLCIDPYNTALSIFSIIDLDDNIRYKTHFALVYILLWKTNTQMNENRTVSQHIDGIDRTIIGRHWFQAESLGSFNWKYSIVG